MSEEIYRDFAEVYAEGGYPKMSEKMVEVLPEVFEHFEFYLDSILDLACGEGSFAVEMAKKGYDVTGVDISPEMLKFARGKAEKESVKIDFIQQDMKELSLEGDFDLVTCWGDSLNYILEKNKLERVFINVNEVLRDGGFFIFDMNTLYAMKEVWTSPAVVSQDNSEIFDITRNEFDEDTNITEMTMTVFLKEKGDLWRKVEEVHHERGYKLEEIRGAFQKAGFKERAAWENPSEMEDVKGDSKRVWFVLKKVG